MLHNKTSTLKIWTTSSHLLHANICMVGFVKQNFRSSATVPKIEVIFWAYLKEIGHGKLGLHDHAKWSGLTSTHLIFLLSLTLWHSLSLIIWGYAML